MFNAGLSTDWVTAERPWEATVLSRVPVTSPSILGKYAPRSDPYAAAAARALAHDRRVRALFRSPRSTTSANVRRGSRCSRSAGITGWWIESLARFAGGGLHATFDAGATPDTP